MIKSLGDLEPGVKLKGTVKQVELAGAVIDVGIEECDAVIHISQIRRRRVNNVRDYLEEGQAVTVWAYKVDKINTLLQVTMIQPPDLTWEAIEAGQLHSGKVTRIEKFGVFVDIGAERPGLVHISELAHGFVNSPDDVVTKGDVVEVKVVGVDRTKRQIDLSIKAATPEPVSENVMPDVVDEPEEEPLTAMAIAMQRALEGSKEGKKSSRRDDLAENSEQDDIIRRTLARHKED